MANRQVFDTIRLSPREIRSLLNEHEPDQAFDESGSRRVSRRWSMAGRKILVSITDEAQMQQHYIAIARDLSATGLSFLHGGYLHNGADCLVTLPTVNAGEPQTIEATIVRCRHMEKHLHDIGVKFKASIDPRRFIDFGSDHVFTIERVAIQDLHGTLLVIEDSRMFQKLIASYFSGSNLELQFAGDGKEALDLIDQLPDMVFVDNQLPDMTGLEVIKEARERGYGGPIILLTADTTPGLRRKAIEAGANEMLTKPAPPALLHQAAAEFLLTSKMAAAAQAQIISTADPATINRELLIDYIDELQQTAKELTELASTDDIEKVRLTVTQVKSSASGFGFEPIADVAEEALRSIDSTMSVLESRTVIQRLSMACRRAAPPLASEDVKPMSDDGPVDEAHKGAA